MPEEINTSLIWKKALSDGKKVLFPKCLGDYRMKFCYIDSEADLQPGRFGLLEPVSEKEFEPEHSDICVIPAFSYDKYGYRLGYGKGYYDRFLSGFFGAKVGLCYSGFVESQLPRGRYDVKADAVSYTHLDVYKRQVLHLIWGLKGWIFSLWRNFHAETESNFWSKRPE